MKIPEIWTQPIRGYDPWKNSDDFFFDTKAAYRVCGFFPKYFSHGKGEFCGKPFFLNYDQKKIIGYLFGWKRKSDNTRRYREFFYYVPKKNGKTQLAAGIALVCLVADNEPGAEVYSASGDKDQAALIYEAGTYMVENNLDLSKSIKIQKGYKLMKFSATESYWKVLSSEAKTKHGPNIHCLILDELHVFRNNELIETLQRGTISRRQPLTCYLTTADFARESPCNTLLAYAQKVRDGDISNKYFLPVIYETPIDADWTKEEVWKAVNPNYGVSVKKSYFESEVQKAKEEPTKEDSFKRLHLNIQTKTEKQWMSINEWDASGQRIEKDELRGKICFSGLDLSSSVDIAAFVLYFPEYYACLPWFWVPEATAKKRIEYDLWAKQGFITISKGRVIDYDIIQQKIIDAKNEYQVVDNAYDGWNATQLVKNLADNEGLPMIEFRQGYKSMNEPTKELYKLVLAHKLIHFGNPVLRWMASNAKTKEDDAGNIKLIKPTKDSPLKIDGIIALVMAMGLAINHKQEEKSIYDSDSFDKVLKNIYGC